MMNLKFYGERIISGPGSLASIEKLEAKRIMVVTGKSAMFKNGAISKIKKILEARDLEYQIYSGIGSDPDIDTVLDGLKSMKAFEPDLVLAIGGGSAIDAAKVMTLMCEYQDLTIEVLRTGQAPQKRKKIRLVAIPSTSGTATEVTRAAVVTFPDQGLKIGLKTEAFIPDIAILDGELTLSMPQNVVAESGLDALTHALESYINKNANDFTKAMSKGALEGLLKNLPSSYHKGDLESRQHVHNFQCLAGFAFQNAGLGMDHGISHSIGGHFGMGHGLLNAIGLPYVIAYNSRDQGVKEDLKALSQSIGKDILSEIKALNKELRVPKSFQEAGIDETIFRRDYEGLLDNALKGSTIRNPVLMDRAEMDKVLKSIYYGKVLF